MKVFLTGSEGRIGKHFSSELNHRGIDFVGFDSVNGQDLLDPKSISSAIRGCTTVVHLALLSAERGSVSQNSMGDNLNALFNLLVAAELNLVQTVVFMSSVDVLGIFKGESQPSYFPIDDDHPCHPSTEYGMGKLLGEAMCKAWSERTGIRSIVLRPPGVWIPETYGEITELRSKRPSYEWDPYWEYGAFIDVRDLFEVSLNALTKNGLAKHARYLVSSSDITTSGRGTLELVDMLHPDVPWRDNKNKYEEDRNHSLVDCASAMLDLEWRPSFTWQRYRESRKGEKSNL